LKKRIGFQPVRIKQKKDGNHEPSPNQCLEEEDRLEAYPTGRTAAMASYRCFSRGLDGDGP
jgi:hypothetical protein